jgi:hypothetical protein
MKKVLHVTDPKLYLIALLVFAATLCFGVSSVQAAKPANPGPDSKLRTVLQKLDAVSCAASGFIDNLDGTVCDCVRDLIWEKKTGTVDAPVDCISAAACPDPHDVNNKYSWTSTGTDFDGTASTIFLAQLNDVAGGGANCFAGYCDWGLPEAGPDAGVKELETILDLSKGLCGGGIGACINSIFGPTTIFPYWSSTTGASNTFLAWFVDFFNGTVSNGGKLNFFFARAVRPCS